MRCIRILPDTWARTLWPLSISTRNIALGNGSTTVPSTSIASSLLIISLPPPWRLGRTPSVDADREDTGCSEHDGSRDLDSPSRTGRSRHAREYHAFGAWPHGLFRQRSRFAGDGPNRLSRA